MTRESIMNIVKELGRQTGLTAGALAAGPLLKAELFPSRNLWDYGRWEDAALKLKGKPKVNRR